MGMICYECGEVFKEDMYHMNRCPVAGCDANLTRIHDYFVDAVVILRGKGYIIRRVDAPPLEVSDIMYEQYFLADIPFYMIVFSLRTLPDEPPSGFRVCDYSELSGKMVYQFYQDVNHSYVMQVAQVATVLKMWALGLPPVD
jgi:hypothetical protein